MSSWQWCPSHPGVHAQPNAKMWMVTSVEESSQVPPFWQGFDQHSLMSCSHEAPPYPCGQKQTCEKAASKFVTLLAFVTLLYTVGLSRHTELSILLQDWLLQDSLCQAARAQCSCLTAWKSSRRSCHFPGRNCRSPIYGAVGWSRGSPRNNELAQRPARGGMWQLQMAAPAAVQENWRWRSAGAYRDRAPPRDVCSRRCRGGLQHVRPPERSRGPVHKRGIHFVARSSQSSPTARCHIARRSRVGWLCRAPVVAHCWGGWRGRCIARHLVSQFACHFGGLLVLPGWQPPFRIC